MGEMQTITINGKKYEIEGHPPYLSDQGTWMVYDTEANAYVDTQISGVGHDYVLTAEDKAEIASMHNTLTVTYAAGAMSHTIEEIYAHVQGGGNVELSIGNARAPLTECTEKRALFARIGYDQKLYTYDFDPSSMISFMQWEYPVNDMIQMKITAPDTAQIGQTIVVKKVNSNGEPTAWEAVDLPSGGAPSWNDIPDKPFITVGGDTLTWDGNTEGLVCVADWLYKMSDAVPTVADFGNGATWVIGGDEVTLDAATIQGAFAEDGLLAMTVFIIPVDGYILDDMIFPSKGVYFPLMEGDYMSSLTIPGYTGFTTEKIDTKVLPGSDVVVVKLDLEKAKLDRTPAEITALLEKGCLVFLNATMTPLITICDDDGTTTGAYSFFMQGQGVSDGKLGIMCMQWYFDAEGNISGQEAGYFEATALG